MQLSRVVCASALFLSSVWAQEVKIANESFYGTALEVNDTMSITITGAAANAPVTLKKCNPYCTQTNQQNYTYGNTNGSGYWYQTSTLTSSDVGTWEEHWLVNGVEVPWSNPNITFVPYAPTLPSFPIYALNIGTNCPGQETDGGESCSSGGAQHWVWSPIGYNFASSFMTYSEVYSAAQGWNNAQGKLSLAYYSGTFADIGISDDDQNLTGGKLGKTFSYGTACAGACYNQIDNCTGKCLNAAAMWSVNIVVNYTEVTNQVEASGVSEATVIKTTISHELGHALRLKHTALYTGTCSEAQSIMYPSGSVLIGCGITPSTTSCDASGINSVYPNSVASCSLEGSYCATHTSC